MNNNIFALYNQLRQNPTALLRQRFNISQGVDMSNPNAIIQDLLNTGQISQAQINNIAQMRNNPLVQMLMRN